MMSKSLLLFSSLFFISCFPLLSSSFSFSNSTKLCPYHQTLALLHLKQSFSINNSSSSDCHYNGVMSYPKTESWKKGSDCCSWDGVAYDKVTGHVIGLDLGCSWLFGIIHSNSTLFLFPHLRRLNLASNDFNGFSISTGAEFAPHDFNSLVQNLTKLQKLHLGVSNLFQNNLTRTIPRGNRFETSGNDSYNGNSGLYGFPLSKKCIVGETLELSKEADAEFESGFDWKITLMGYGYGLVIGYSLECLVFLTGKPKWLTMMVEENIHRKITRSKRSTCRKGATRSSLFHSLCIM
ncbi:hypothetical protein VitviT2T_004007 [Vitis vinifera]|uniref:Receptor-like protein 12 n=1 Tax=Vitis vinifera TaxID=29760 RepID=A0ABY9BPT4_VITVI|nr:hypothetical protein VitviT2T_004007 [Vitis vinifera]